MANLKVHTTCPFCASLNLETISVDIEDREGVPKAVYCTDCGAPALRLWEIRK